MEKRLGIEGQEADGNTRVAGTGQVPEELTAGAFPQNQEDAALLGSIAARGGTTTITSEPTPGAIRLDDTQEGYRANHTKDQMVIRLVADAIETNRMRIVRRGDLDWFQFSGVMSTKKEDSYGDIIEPAGWKFNKFKKNSPLLLQHSPRDVMGKVRKYHRIKDVGLMADTAEILMLPSIEETVAKIRAEILKGLSVGFRILEGEPIDEKNPWGGWHITSAELWELSVVTFPANPDTWIDQNEMKAAALAYQAELVKCIRSGFPFHAKAFPEIPWINGEPVGEAPQVERSYFVIDGMAEDAASPSDEVVEEYGASSFYAAEKDGTPVLRFSGMVEGKAVFSRKALIESMGLVFTAKQGLSISERRDALRTLTAVYEDCGLEAPVIDGKSVDDYLDETTDEMPHFKAVEFKGGEDKELTPTILRGNLVSVTSGAKNLINDHRVLEADEDKVLVRDCLTNLLQLLPTRDAADYLLGVLGEEVAEPVADDTSADESPGTETETGIDLDGFLEMMGIDPDDPERDAKVAALIDQLNVADPATLAAVGELLE